LEIVARTGTLSQDGGHLHLPVADHQGCSFGGHLAEGCTVRTIAEVVLAADDRLVFARNHDLPPARTSWWSASATREARDGHRVLAAWVHSSPGNNRLVAARAREAAAGLTDSWPKTHTELCPAVATRCHSLLRWTGYTRH
jgi:DUF296 family protein family protein